MYYNPFCNYWGMYPKMPVMGYHMGKAKEHYYYCDKAVTKDQKELLRKIMELEFAAIELNLYLDTHSMDREAIDQFNKYVKRLKELKETYREKYGPLTAEQESDYPWEYVQGPWPWEI